MLIDKDSYKFIEISFNYLLDYPKKSVGLSIPDSSTLAPSLDLKNALAANEAILCMAAAGKGVKQFQFTTFNLL